VELVNSGFPSGSSALSDDKSTIEESRKIFKKKLLTLGSRLIFEPYSS